jgi:hypothetical protein
MAIVIRGLTSREHEILRGMDEVLEGSTLAEGEPIETQGPQNQSILLPRERQSHYGISHFW